MEKYKITPIKSFLDALQVREIRNQCRTFMTNDTSKIGFLRQLKWYFFTYKTQKTQNKLTVFLFKSGEFNLGFGLIKESSGKYWITGGLKTEQRGKGLGKFLFRQLINNTPSSTIWLEVLDSNIAAKTIYKNLGFRRVRSITVNRKKVILMNLRNINK